MISTNKTEAFFSFLDEYTAFFGEMERFEQNKLMTMLSGNMPEIEHLLTASQANAKKLDNLERRRMQLQQEAGFGTMSMGELATATGGTRGDDLQQQLRRLSTAIENIRFYNTKSMTLAEDNLRRIARHTGVAADHARLGGKA